MKVIVSSNKVEAGRKAAHQAAEIISSALREKPEITIVVATGASQFQLLEELVQLPGIDWSRVTAFHLDEYVGLPMTHPASFRGYLNERFVGRLPVPLKEFIAVNGDASDPMAEAARLGKLLAGRTIEVTLAGIGENGHLAFNDPPADFETESPFLVVELDKDCRRQQMNEGWFPTINDVPERAISMSVQQIMKSKNVVVTCPDARKAEAVRATLEGVVSNTVPASILQKHPGATLYLDEASASLLNKRTYEALPV